MSLLEVMLQFPLGMLVQCHRIGDSVYQVVGYDTIAGEDRVPFVIAENISHMGQGNTHLPPQQWTPVPEWVYE